MAIRIVTDSTCDLPEAVVTEHGITIVPLYISCPRVRFHLKAKRFTVAFTLAPEL
jgi:fatty acid-binding protein DegV